MLNRNKSRINGAKFNSMNQDVLGSWGYQLVYNLPEKGGHPDADFVSFKDKWNKKAPSVWAKSSILTVFVLQSYLRAMRLVAEHYISAVGRFYNVCVVLTNYTYLNREVLGPSRIVPFKVAMAVSWRLLYEGLGLAGWSPNARLFLALLTAAAFGYNKDPMNPKFTLEKDEDWNDTPKGGKIPVGYKPVTVKKDTAAEKQYPALGYLAELMNIKHIKVWKQVTRLIVWATKVSFDWSAIEGGRARVNYMSSYDYNLACVMGAIRRAGQGKDEAGMEQLFAEQALAEMMDNGGEPTEDIVLPTSCLREIIHTPEFPGDDTYIEEWADEILKGCPILKDTVMGASIVHTQIEDYIFGGLYQDEEM